MPLSPARHPEDSAMSKPKRRLAVSYSRFSDPTQGKGDSEERQADLFAQFCRRHNLTPVREAFTDRGRSGYTDEHRKKGRLGQLVALAKDGRFEPGTIIVVEAWDRLGRLRPDKQTELVAELLRTGISIGVCRLDDLFCEDDFGTHKWTTLAVFIQLAYQESKQKAERVADSWRRRRDRVRERGGLLSRRLPAWLEEVNGEARPVPERAATVRRIFKMAADGMGHTRIVNVLTREGVPPFGEHAVSEGRGRSQFSGRWSHTYVALILRDRRVTGEWQPRLIGGEPDGPVIAHYYPAVVTEEEFLLAQAAREQRRNRDKRGRASGPRQSKYVNTFKGLLTHARDGQGFVLHNKATKASPKLLLVNGSGAEGRGRRWMFPYLVFEEGILGLLREVDPRDVLPKKGETPSQADVLRGRLANVRGDVAGLQQELKAGFSKALAAVLREKEEEEERLAAELMDELAKSVVPAERAWKELPSLVAMIQKADDPDAVRLKLHGVLRRVIDSTHVLIVPRGVARFCAVQFFFAGGGRRDYLILHRPAGNRRAESWAAWSLKDVVKVGAFDLKNPKDAAALERVLADLDLDELEEQNF
jgi:DNA invertase Pin-like site-specific DNA recombinase